MSEAKHTISIAIIRLEGMSNDLARKIEILQNQLKGLDEAISILKQMREEQE